MLAKECQNYQASVHNRPMMTSQLACHSSEDLWQQQNYDSSESISSMSSGHSIGTPSSGHTNQDIAHPYIRSSLSYPYIPPSTLSGRVHDPTPRSSLPMASLDTVPPSHHVRRMDGSPATAAVMQNDPFNFRPDPQYPASTQNAGEMFVPDQYPHGALGQCSLPGGSPNSLHTSKQKTVTSEVRYRVNPAGVTGELGGPTYLSTTSVNMSVAEAGSSGPSVDSHVTRTGLPYSLFPTAVSSKHLSNAYINPQQVWVRSPHMPKTYISSLSSSCECLPSVTGASEAAARPSLSSRVPSHSPYVDSPCQNSNSPRPSSEDVDSPEYIHGT